MIGIDIVSIDRIKKMYEKFGDKFYDRFLCEDEKKLAIDNKSFYDLL